MAAVETDTTTTLQRSPQTAQSILAEELEPVVLPQAALAS
jgi:hypothetical protein